MGLVDLLRFIVFAAFGVGVGFMVCTNVIAFKVLRPPKKLGFLWWHVTSISLSFVMTCSVALDAMANRLGGGLTWYLPVLLPASILFATAQSIIFMVERRRLIAKRALDQVMSRVGA